MMSSSKVFLRALILILTLPSIIVSPVRPTIAEDQERQKLIKCDVHHTSCTDYVSNTKITLDIRPKPVKAMKALTFVLEVSGNQPSSKPYIDLGMPGMHMGPNRVALEAVGEGIYEGQGIIVRCPSGRKTWRAEVTVPGVGMVKFIFDVIY
jgi:hypothetical protein